MNYLQQFVSEELIYALGWTVIHSIWQALLVALLVAALTLGFKKQSAQARYVSYYIGMLGVLFLAVFTFLDLYQWGYESAVQQAVFVGETAILDFEEMATDSHWMNTIIAFFDKNMSLIVLVWLMGVVFFMIRLVGGVAAVQYLKNTCHDTIPIHIKEKMWALMNRIPLRQSVRLVESALVKVPMVIGYLKPMILLPLGTIHQLNPKELEAILAHELAHIARNDYILNVLQSVIDVLFYFNPAVWWLSANVRVERENCCDDIAVELCGNSLTYAKALVSLQEVNQLPPMLAMPFAGKRNQLLHRIQRILKQPQNRNNIMEKIMATCLLILTIGLFSFTNQSQQYAEEMPSSVSSTAFETTLAMLDTIPRTTSTTKDHVITETNGRKIEYTRENGAITSLKINNKEIPPSEWKDHASELKAMELRMPAPPAPPVSPISESDFPMAPPVPSVSPAPPASSCAPTPKKYKKKMKTKKGNTSVIIIEQLDGDDGVVYELKGDEHIVWDGDGITDTDSFPSFRAIVIEDGDGFEYAFSDEDFPQLDYLNQWQHDFDETYQKTIESFLKQQENYRDLISEEQWQAIEEAFEEQLEHMEEQRASVFEQQKEAHEQMRVAQAEAHEQMKVAREEARVQMRETREQMREVQEQIEYDYRIEMEELERQNLQNEDGNLGKVFGEELYFDGVIKNKDRFRFKMTSKYLKVNGKNVSGRLHKKYLKLYTKVTKKPFCKSCQINVEHNSKSKVKTRI